MSQSPPETCDPRWKLPSLLAIVSGLIVLSYVGSYAWFYQRGIAEADDTGLPDTFLFVPVESVIQSQDLNQHDRRRKFYEPLNWVHFHWFGGRPACQSILFDLS